MPRWLSRIAVLALLGGLLAGGFAAYDYWRREYGPIDMVPVSEAWERWPGPRYSRADCLVQLNIEVDPGNDYRGESMLETFMRYTSNHEPKAPFNFGGKVDKVFIQFFDECPRRYEIARAMAAYYEKRNGPGVHLTVMDGRIEPGPETIQMCSEVWLDCEQSGQ